MCAILPVYINPPLLRRIFFPRLCRSNYFGAEKCVHFHHTPSGALQLSVSEWPWLCAQTKQFMQNHWNCTVDCRRKAKKERQSHSVICLIFYYLPPAFLTFYLLISKHSEMQLRGQLVHIYYLPQCIEPLVHPMLIVFYPPDVLCLDCWNTIFCSLR